ncbi:YqaE/Pmp3 family membrane protein [Pontibacter sp. 172403-2]|uniref:YqaE/Pmp3 family membrane protein n=1 Tax=Pontibacter rufus TaxID=2791028 RepID=UPI001E61CBAC|nr:YqaE/Pmp3 family membrane protein [Pontibacter sp. 172403-2]
MKLKSLLNLAMVLIMGQLLFACNSAKYYEYAPSKTEAYNQVKQKPAPAEVAAPTLAEVALAAAQEKDAATAEEPVLQASTAAAPVAVPQKTIAPAKAPVAAATVAPKAEVKTVTEAEALAMAKEKLASMTKAEKRELKKEVKEAMYQGANSTSIIEIILAILLPPLAVFLHDGIDTSFWISIILWLLFIIPGIIYALLVVTDTI